MYMRVWGNNTVICIIFRKILWFIFVSYSSWRLRTFHLDVPDAISRVCSSQSRSRKAEDHLYRNTDHLEFLNFYIILFPICQKYMPNFFFTKNIILPPVQPAEWRYRRINRRQVHCRKHTTGSSDEKGTVAIRAGTVDTNRQFKLLYCSDLL